MHRSVLVFFLVGFILGMPSAKAQYKREDFERAEKAIVRLHPGDFPNLPAEARAALEHRGCTIPQPYDARGEKKNVITGRFKSAGEMDWVALCSHEGRSSILIFYGGRPDQVEEIGSEPDSQYLQVVSDGREIGYSRQLAVAPPKAIRRYVAPSDHSPRSIDHDGIEDAFLEKGSALWYRSSKWIKFSGTD